MNNYFMETHHHEWLLTNKRGGYAMGTGNLINQRKYHGLLIASDEKFQRTHLVAGMEELIEWRGESFHLDSNNYSNCVYPEGFLHLVKPWLRPYPIFLYSALPHQEDILILKELFMAEEDNTILIKYTNMGKHKLHFELHPKFTMHNHHQINSPGLLDRENYQTEIKDLETEKLMEARRNSNQVSVYGAITKGEVKENRFSYYNVFYPWEVMNGYDGIGDQITLFEIKFSLAPGESANVLFSDRPLTKVSKQADEIQERYRNLPLPKDYPRLDSSKPGLLEKLDFNDNLLFNREEYLQILEFALTDFISNDDIVAGYPWYGPWGRDTMFTLNALLHTNRHLDKVENILRKYSTHIKDGLIPNMLPESGREANYDSVDATLWFIILLNKMGKRKKSVRYWDEVIGYSEQIIKAILHNIVHPFHIRNDGLIELHNDFAHATWMDIRLDGIAITPRDGAPVEINALWYNAVCSYEAMHETRNSISKRFKNPDAAILSYKGLIKDAFQKFWHNGYLADRLYGDEPVMEIRPNALLATALPYNLLSEEQIEQVFLHAYKELYTYYGIRSLSPNDIKFKKKYYGVQQVRDLACHNGSVWAWLLGAFCGVYLKAYAHKKTSKELVYDLTNFIGNLRQSFMKGHIASVAELWDGDAPHFPKGAPAMAWSVAALYNVELYIAHLEANPR